MLMRVLIMALAIAIGMQNTCPLGQAAKTAFVSCHQCPMQGHKPATQGEKAGPLKVPPTAYQSFVLNIAPLMSTFLPLPKPGQTVSHDMPDPKEIFSDSLFRPPIPFNSIIS